MGVYRKDPHYLFGYPAGKVHLAKRIVDAFPQHSTYVEPFCGSAAVFFEKGRANVEAIGDMSTEVVFVLRDVRDLSKSDLDLLSRLDWTATRERYVDLLRREPKSRVGRVHRFLFLSRFSAVRGYFSRTREGGFDTSETGKNHGDLFMRRIRFARDRLRGVEVRRCDYQKLVEKYDSEDTLFFFDPPYIGTHGRFHGGGKSFDEHRFERVLRSIKGRFIVTYGTEGKANFDGFEVQEIERKRLITSGRFNGDDSERGTITERVISNFPMTKISKADDSGDSETDAKKSDGFDWTGMGCDVCGFGTVEDLEKFDPDKPCPDCGATMRVPYAKATESHVFALATLPAVLSVGAPMPPDGVSALPASLEADVPEAFRYWTRKGEDARMIRDALVRSGLFTEDTIAKVDGELRRIERVPSLPEPPEPISFEKRIVQVFDADVRLTEVDDAATPEEMADFEKFEGVDVLFADESPAAIEALSKFGTVFSLVPGVGFFEQSEGKIFASAGEIKRPEIVTIKRRYSRCKCMEPTCKEAPAIDCVWADGRGRAWFCKACFTKWRDACPDKREIVRMREVEGEVPEKFGGKIAKSEDLFDGMPNDMPIIKASEERFVFGVVLEPETTDSQGDIYSAEEVRQTAHKFLAKFQNIGLQHRKLINSKVQILESFVAPIDFEIGTQKVKKGTWLLAVRVIDDALWNAVKSGNITGFSIGGTAKRIPLSAAA